MASRHKETLKNIKAGLSEEQKLNNLMLDRLYKAVVGGNKTQADILTKAIEVLFPRSKVMVADAKFRAFWKLGEYQEAIKAHREVGRLFWHSAVVARHYERRGLIQNAIIELRFLVDTYCKMDNFLPVPTGPEEVFRLGRLYAVRKNKSEARRYLRLYLSAEKCKTDPAFHLRYGNTAKRILNELDKSKG